MQREFMPLFVSKGLGVRGLFQQVVERKKIPQVWASIIHTMVNRKTTCVHTFLLVLLSFLVLVLADDEEGGGGLSLMDILRGGTVGYPLSLNVAGRDEKLFNVHDFKSNDKSAEADDSGDYPGGPAKGEMLSDYTQAFQQAWRAACDFQGKARLVIPKGEYTLGQVVFSGPCRSASATTPLVIQLEGHLKAVTDLSRYTSPEWITFDTIDGLLITGGGTFDGQGQSAWGHNNCHANDNKCQLLACNIRFYKAKNTNIRQVTSLNSKGFHIVIFGSTNFRAYMLNIVAPEDSPNTDGIHVSNSSNIKISKSNIATGDDCISIYQGSSNIYVSSLTCGPGHGISVGSLGKHANEKEVRGITVKNATLLNTTNGIRIKTWPGSPPGRAYAFTFADIIMKNVKNPIIIDQSYCASGNCKGSKTQKPSGIQISNVFYRNIKGTSATPDAISFVCSKTFPCKNVRLVDVDLTLSPLGQKGKKGLASPVATCSCENADVRSIGRVNPRPACLV